ncbi:hypothetical protein [uncultured Paracoccus sp.]|uniref:hypothetical protein n=1 Tax=uncultured Paracoccus sp. TaxID=189685 RepID=UPI000C947162|nr:hypothetical protein [uncultured Paracoccus sp.]MAM41109.1 hypothetical protein [Erythrobacter sp.]|tara:strand:- start:88 stop:552 length:465 start_codon:yes stop_codon:yes gene_type:complete
MRRLTLLATATAILCATMPAAYARNAAPTQPAAETCQRDNPDCARQNQKAGKNQKAGQGQKATAPAKSGQSPQKSGQPAQTQARSDKAVKTATHAPRAGDNGKAGKPFQRSANSRFKAPPKGEEYRVVDDHLVLVDSNTMKIVTVLGLLSALSK